MEESYIERRFGIVMEEIRDVLIDVWASNPVRDLR